MKEIIKSITDNHEYKYIELDNNVKCLLISNQGNYK